MKTFSFYTQKGGCGKTTLLLLFASYLRYAKGKTVKVIDFEANKFPLMHFREKDMVAFHQAGSALYNYLNGRSTFDPYPIECAGKEINTYQAEDVLELARAVNEEIRQDKFDYLLLDFPAGYSRLTPVSCLVHNHLLSRKSSLTPPLPWIWRNRNSWATTSLAPRCESKTSTKRQKIRM